MLTSYGRLKLRNMNFVYQNLRPRMPWEAETQQVGGLLPARTGRGDSNINYIEQNAKGETPLKIIVSPGPAVATRHLLFLSL